MTYVKTGWLRIAAKEMQECGGAMTTVHQDMIPAIRKHIKAKNWDAAMSQIAQAQDWIEKYERAAKGTPYNTIQTLEYQHGEIIDKIFPDGIGE